MHLSTDGLASIWDALNANGGGIAALAAISTALVAIGTLWSARTDSQERSRPMVLAEFRKPPNSRTSIDLVVRNAGPSIARNVEVKFDLIPTVASNDRVSTKGALMTRYRDSIPTLAPGQELVNTWFAGVSGDHPVELVNSATTSDEVTVTIAYRGSGRRRRYVDRFPLHIDLVRMGTSRVDSSSPLGCTRSIDESLKAVRDSTKRLARAVEALQPELDDEPL
jgi:hypothetical protein